MYQKPEIHVNCQIIGSNEMSTRTNYFGSVDKRQNLCVDVTSKSKYKHCAWETYIEIQTKHGEHLFYLDFP